MGTEKEFGRIITAMVTPFRPDLTLNLDSAQKLARWLTEEGRNDGLVVNGTTGESVATSDTEKNDLVRCVADAVDEHVRVIAGVGTSDTRHSVELAQGAEAAGAHGLLVVTPYYSRPSQEGILQHFLAIAEATSLPVMLYDIPKRTGLAIGQDTMARAGEHERIRAVKDAKGDLEASSWVMARTDLAFYSGDDALNLPLLSIGATGFVSVVGHVVADQLRSLLIAYRTGDTAEALRIHQRLLPIYKGMFRAPAAALAKASLDALGLPGGPVRPPLVGATGAERTTLAADLLASAVAVPASGAAPQPELVS